VSTIARYTLLQIPGWIITAAVLAISLELGFLSFRVAAILFGLLVLKDAIVYPFVRRSYEPAGENRVEDLVGHLAEVRRELSPEGYVCLRGELWRAEASVRGELIAPGHRVRVVGARGLTLIVVRESGDAGDGSDRRSSLE
jgi:membrane protein implicated in regulation of membrane protease activity